MGDKNKRTCCGCTHWEMGIPCGHCLHPDGDYFLFTTDEMVFHDAGDRCPLNKKEN